MKGRHRRRSRQGHLALLAVLLVCVAVAGLTASSQPQTRNVGAVTKAGVTRLAPSPSPPPVVGPQGPVGVPLSPSPPPAPAGTPACTGKTKVSGIGIPKLYCEVAPGKWVEIDPKHPPSSLSPPGSKKCPGKQKTLFVPGAPMPDLLCEVKPGVWVQDPHSPYVESIKNQKPVKAGCGFGDVGCMAKEAVTGWFKDLVESATKPVFRFLSATVLGTPEIGSRDMTRTRELWGTSQVIANTCFVLVITIAGVLLMAGQSVPGELSPKDLLPRVILAFLAVNLSLVLIGYGISFANSLARAFLAAGASKVDPHEAGRVLANGVEATINTGGIFFILVALVAIVFAVIVAFIYVIRLAITMVLIAAAPLALMFHALPMTDGLARLWWRGFTGMLAIQVCQSLVFVTAIQLLFSQDGRDDAHFWGIPNTKTDLIDLLLIICLLYVMIRIPSWVARTIWRPAQPRMLGQLVRSFLVYRTVSAVVGAAGRAARAARGQAGGPGPHRGPNGPRTRRSGGNGPNGGPGPRGGTDPGAGGSGRHKPHNRYGGHRHGGDHHGRPRGGYHSGYGPRADQPGRPDAQPKPAGRGPRNPDGRSTSGQAAPRRPTPSPSVPPRRPSPKSANQHRSPSARSEKTPPGTTPRPGSVDRSRGSRSDWISRYLSRRPRPRRRG